MTDDEIVCTIRFESDDSFTYQDTVPKYDDKPVRGPIDRTCLSWRTAQVLSGWVRDSGSPIRRPELELLGRHLHELLFGGDIGGWFRAAYQACMKFHARFRVELHFAPGAQAVAELPWEFLFVPEDTGGFFLAARRDDIVLTRLAMPGAGQAPEVAVAERPLRVLVASCSPDTAIDVQQIMASVRALSSAEAIDVTTLPDPTFDELLDRVSQPRMGPHVLHIVGHGQAGGMLMRQAISPGDAALAEANLLAGVAPRNGQQPRVLVDADTVTSLFTVNQPHLVFLHSCDGDAPSLTSVYSTARKIVYSSVPAVVAMQYQIPAGAAIRFVDKFYRALAAGSSVGEAVTAGRCDLAKGSEDTGSRTDWATRLFGTPVVYLRRDMPLVGGQEMRASPSPVPGPPPPPRQLACPRCSTPLGLAPECQKCRLRLVCTCGVRYDRPETIKFCSSCGVPVTQAAWPAHSQVVSLSGWWSSGSSREATTA